MLLFLINFNDLIFHNKVIICMFHKFYKSEFSYLLTFLLILLTFDNNFIYSFFCCHFL